jgi:5'-phosphate synthase pdxT subunit
MRTRSANEIGVLALHGAVIEHIQTLRSIGVEPVAGAPARGSRGLSGLILPGGESTTMRKLVARWGCASRSWPWPDSGAPILGTCAGMILVAKEIAGGEEPVFPLLDVTVERNAFGRQLDSFETELADADPGRPAGPRDLHPRPHNRARGTRRGGSGAAARTGASWRSASAT